MLGLQTLYLLIKVTDKIFGRKTAKTFLDLIMKKQRFFFIDKIYDFDEKKTVSRLTLLLPGKGCEWAKKTGGCTMCAFWRKSLEIGKNFSSNDLILLYDIADTLTKNKKPFILIIYNGGSFLNDTEITPFVQREICRKVRNHFSLKTLLVESRVEFINERKIKILKNELGEKKLMVGIGLESQDDKIRQVFIKKGLEKKDYEEAVELLKKNNVKVLTYVFLKPVYLTEKEAIKETVKTINYAFDVGTDVVALEAAFIQPGTLMAKLFKEKKYKPPWLWSIIEVIKKTSKLGPIHIGGFEDEPSPLAIPSNCSLCSQKINNLIQKYRETNDISLFSNLDCQCRKKWEKEIKD